MEQLFIETRFLVNNAHQSGIEVANETQYLIVHGQPGSGKSVFLKWLAMEALKREERIYNHQLIPVFIDAERLNSPDINLLSLIKDEFLLADLPYVDKFTKEALKMGRLLILIDEIDRIPEENHNRSRAITHIQDFIHLYDKNRFVVSCRTQNRYIYRGKLGYPQRELATWNDDQMQSYIQKYSHTHKWPDSTDKNLWRFLQETTNSQVQDLVRIPVYLTYLCIYYQQQSFPRDGSFLEGLDLKSAIEYRNT
ncbi:NACHT domain-containing NTPase [Nostoc sp. CENA543]|uniref:NACHT domain-containing protein n=1 Tax=Nostoc sp. CENA543 TaxID=1869241 RepID=UPI0012FFF523|nr:NACHT domain-containing protein [Nostoc sp. CENA543]